MNGYSLEPGKGPKIVYVESANFRILNGMHHIALHSGGETFTFAFPLPGSKGLGRGLLKQIEQIEKKNGVTVPSRLDDEPLESPLRMDQLGGGEPPKDSK